MASMRRRLRGLTTRVSGALAAAVPEAPVEAAAPVSETGEVPPVTETAPEPVEALEAVREIAVDPACADAVDLARAVAVEAGGATVGDHLGVEAEDDLVVTHSFATTDPAYVGWRWSVTVTRAEGSADITVDDVVLLPGSGALVAPAWVPWSERVQPGDLSPGDLLPPAPDDLRIVPAYTDTEGELAVAAFWELGLGRPRVLSFDGRLDAAERWYDGDHGPHTPMARQAPGQCLDCAFRVPLAGGLAASFGVCANGLAPDDGKVVSLDHGCGAHSETPVELTHSSDSAGMVVEDEELELVATGPSPDDETPDGHAS
ncbi:MAG: hypothetical protein JWO12_2542 [Frankiales bacterium]|nr:hypothetical protein [Frankiales bacterium]